MAKKCNVNFEEIFKAMSSIELNRSFEIINNSEAREQFRDLIHSFGSKYKQSELEEAVLETASQLGIRGQEQIFFSDEMVKDLLSSKLKLNPTLVENNTTERLTNADLNKDREKVTSQFLSDAYGIASNVKEKAEKQATVKIIRACIADFHKGIAVKTNEELNANLIKYQEDLINTIISYIKSEYDYRKDKSTFIGNPYEDFKDFLDKNGKYKLYKQNSEGDLVYTGIVDIINKYSSLFSPENISGQTLIQLNESANNVNDSQYERSKTFLDVYNSWQILTHFDSMMDIVFGKALEINHFGDCVFDFPNKYRFAEKGGSNKTSWRNKEEINLGEEVSKLVQSIINSIPIIDYQTNNEIEDSYLSINKLQSVLHLIKDLCFNKINDIILPRFDEDGNEIYSDYERKIIFKYGLQDKIEFKNGRAVGNIMNIDLVKLANNIGENPQAIFPLVIKLILNNINQINPKLKSQFRFDKEKLNILKSLDTYIFNLNPDIDSDIKSLNFITGDSSEGNYYSYITQTCDSIFKINFSQYFKDSNGILHLRKINSGEIEKTRRIIENGIKIKNSRFLQRHSEHKEKYPATLNVDTKDKKRRINSFDLDIPGVPKVTVRPSAENPYSISKEFGFTENEKKNMLEFINEILNLSLTDADITRINELTETPKDESYKNLFLLASDVYFMAEVSNTFLRAKDGTTLLKDKKIIETLLDNFSPKIKFDSNFQEINLIRTSSQSSENHLITLPTLNNLAILFTSKNGGLDNSQIKNGEGNSQSAAVLSRLLNRLNQQYQGHIIGNENAAARQFSILNPDIFQGVYVSLEYTDGNTTRSNEKFNLAEFIHSGFISNFIKGFDQNTSYNSVNGKGHILINASVNSDKKTIDLLDINTNATVKLNGIPIRLREMSNNQLMEFINQEIGNYYKTCIYNIQSDFNKLSQFHSQIHPEEGSLDLPNFTTGDIDFSRFNQRWLNPKEKLENLVSEYNKLNPKNPIQLIDQVHFISDKPGQLYANQTLLACYYRFNPNILSPINELGNPIYPSFNYFWNTQKSELVKSIVRSGTKFDLTSDDEGMASLRREVQFLDLDSSTTEQGYDWNEWIYDNPIAFVKEKLNSKDLISSDNRYIYKGYIVYIDEEKGGYYITHPDQLPKSKDNLIIRPYNSFEINKIIAKELNNKELNILLKKDPTNTKKINELIDILVKENHFEYLYEYQLKQNIGAIYKKYNPHFKSDFKLNFDKYIDVPFTWIDDATGYMIIAKAIMPDGTIKDIISNQIPKNYTSLELNPKLEQYMLMDYLFSQEFMISSVGSCIAHPVKSGMISNPKTASYQAFLEEEAGRFQVQHKRNVSFTATMQKFQLGQLDGIPTWYNIAILDDIRDDNYNVNGVSDGTKPFDGATFVNPFVVYLENNSLNGAKAGFTKKQFVHYYDARTGTGGIIKTCGFALMNTTLINSRLHRNLFKKMSDRTWIDMQGKDVSRIIDITKNYRGETIDYGDVYMIKNGKLTKIDKITKNPEGNYTIDYVEVNEFGDEIGKLNSEIKEIKSNYDLWNVFGGYNSIELIDGKLNPKSVSENSIRLVVKAMNEIGFNNNMSNIKPEQIIRTQDDIYQPLKHADIHYMPTIGAVKQGAANINGLNVYYDNSNDVKFMRIKMDQAGIQLDKEHHATGEDLSLMTQVISSCAHAGFTRGYAQLIYLGLARLGDIRTKELYNAFREKNNSNLSYENFIKVVVETVIKEMSKDEYDENSVLYNIAKVLLNKVNAGQEITYEEIEKSFAIDNNTILPQFVSKLSTFLTKAGIKLKQPGVLSVLTPSHESFKLYDVMVPDGNGGYTKKTLKLQEILKNSEIRDLTEKYKNEKNDSSPITEDDILNVLQDLQKEIGTSSEIRIRKTYKVIQDGKELYYQINLPGSQIGEPQIRGNKTIIPIGYNLFKTLLPTFSSVKEDITSGRNLLSANFIFEEKGNPFKYQLYDIRSIQMLFDFRDMENRSEFISTYIKDIKESPEVQNLSNEEILNLPTDKLEKILREFVRTDLCQLSKEGSKFIRPKAIKINEVVINPETGNYITQSRKIIVNQDSVKSEDYEVIMPKIFKEEFGLDTFDQLSDIIGNPNYFYEKAINKLGEHTSSINFDIELKRMNGNHIYIMSKDSDLSRLDGFIEIPINIMQENGKIYRVDRNNKIQYELFSVDDKVYYKDGCEVILTGHKIQDGIEQDGLKFYLDTFTYDFPRLSTYMGGERLYQLWDYIRGYNPETKTFEKVKNYKSKKAIIDIQRQSGKNLIEFFSPSNFINSLQESDNLIILKQNSLEKYNCFVKQLEILAARIPAQSMQSFMKMKIAAFDDLDLNTAYVNTDQIWLQGSDYDVDAVSLATFAIDKNGMLPLWSDYADYTTAENLEKSFQIEFPTGEKLERKNIIGQILNSEIDEEIKELAYLLNTIFDENNSFIEIKPGSSERHPVILEFKRNQFDLYNELIKGGNKLMILSDGGIKRLQEYLPDEHPLKNKSINEIRSIIDLLADKVDEHNLYLDGIDQKLEEMIQTNRNHYYILKTISDPSNFVQAQNSVDAMTKHPKDIGNGKVKGIESPDAELVKHRAPGNPINKFESIRENQVGKDGISICAVGLKSFFALSQYINEKVQKGINETKNVAFNINLIDAFGNSLNFRFISGMNVEDEAYNLILKQFNIADSQLARQYMNAFINAKTETDAALQLSALLSLSTDNAKELQLAKLNASINTLGMYLYGLSIGMSFDQIASLMMHPIGKMISQIMESSNVFTGEEAAFSLENAFDYFQVGPRKLFNNVDKAVLNQLQNDLYLNFRYITDSKGKIIGETKCKFIDDYQYLPISDLIGAIAWNNNMSLSEKLELINKYKSSILVKIKFGDLSDNTSNINRKKIQLLDEIEKYIKQISIIKGETALTPGSGKTQYGIYQSLKQLAFGALEMKTLGGILSLNQGLPTKTQEIISKVQDFEQIINEINKRRHNDFVRNEKTESYKNPRVPKKLESPKNSKINLIDFCFNDEYRNKKINEYGQLKHTFNILDCITSVPNFNCYLRMLGLLHASLMDTSNKYNFIYEESTKVINALNATTSKHKEYILNKLSDYYNDYVINEWFRRQTDIKLEISKSIGLVTSDEIKKVKHTLDFKASSARAAQNQVATFKYLMEEEIIPKLKELLPNNKFIQDLIPGLLTRTASNNALTYFTLDANMMPRTDTEISQFNIYKAEVNKLSTMLLSNFCKSNSLKNGIRIKIAEDGKDITLSDLFYMYALVAHYGKQGRQSIIPLFINLHNSGIIQDFHNFESTFSQEKGLRVAEIQGNSKKIYNTDFNEIIDYCTPKDSPYTSNLSQLYYQDPTTLEWKIWEKIKQDNSDPNFGNDDSGVIPIKKSSLHYKARESKFIQYDVYGGATFNTERSVSTIISKDGILRLVFDGEEKIDIKNTILFNGNRDKITLNPKNERDKEFIRNISDLTQGVKQNGELDLKYYRTLISDYFNCKE